MHGVKPWQFDDATRKVLPALFPRGNSALRGRNGRMNGSMRAVPIKRTGSDCAGAIAARVGARESTPP
jgi:hypothetical protein